MNSSSGVVPGNGGPGGRNNDSFAVTETARGHIVVMNLSAELESVFAMQDRTRYPRLGTHVRAQS